MGIKTKHAGTFGPNGLCDCWYCTWSVGMLLINAVVLPLAILLGIWAVRLFN